MSNYFAGLLSGWAIGAVATWFYFHKVCLIKTKAQYTADRLGNESENDQCPCADFTALEMAVMSALISHRL